MDTHPEPDLLYWNYRQRRLEQLLAPPDDWRLYIPQTEKAQTQYAADIAAGKTPMESARGILRMFFTEET